MATSAAGDLRFTPAGITLGGTSAARGKVAGVERRVRVRLQRHDGESWVVEQRGRTSRTGSFRFTLSPEAAGQLSYRVVTTAKPRRRTQPATLWVHPVDSVLGPGEWLRDGEHLASGDGHYTLGVEDGNAVLRVAGGRVLWETSTGGHANAHLEMRTDGTLTVQVGSRPPLWTMPSAGRPSSYLRVQTDGQLVTYDDSGDTWSSSTVNDRLLPGESLRPGWFLQSGDRAWTFVQQSGDGNLVLYGPSGAAWTANTAGHPQATTHMQADGNLVTYDGPALWATGTDGNPGAWTVVQGDGNLVVYSSDGRALWDRYPDAPQVEQAAMRSPIDGIITSHPSNHHIVYGGDWSEDIGSYGGAAADVYVRFTEATGSVSLTIERVRQACRSGQGGLAVDVGVSVDGTRIGRVTYAHLTNLVATSGPIGNHSRLGTLATGLPRDEDCWTGPHVHIEPYNESKYACYDNLGTGSGVDGGTRIGVLGATAGGTRSAC